jgi:hypothetical protein
MPKSTRKFWTEFKKKYPEFEKNAVVKQDLGPALDLFDRAFENADKGTEQEKERAREGGRAAQRVIKAALEAYEQRVKTLRMNPQLMRDFDTVKGLSKGSWGISRSGGGQLSLR